MTIKADVITALDALLGLDVEISHLYKIALLSFTASADTEFDKIALFIVATVLNRIAERNERDGAGDDLVQVSGLVPLALSVLNSRDWDSGKSFLIELAEISNQRAQTH